MHTFNVYANMISVLIPLINVRDLVSEATYFETRFDDIF